jgi:replicative DNA helicase
MSNVAEQLITDQREIEKSLAAMVYKYPQYAAQSLHWLLPEMIATESIAKFWDCIRHGITSSMSAYDAGRVVTEAWLAGGLSKNGDTNAVLEYVDLDVDALGASLREHIYLRNSLSLAENIARAASNKKTPEIKSILSEFKEKQTFGRRSMKSMSEVGESFKAEVEGGSLSIPSGLPKVDLVIGGHARKYTTYYAARPSVGKTGIALQSAKNVAALRKYKVGFFSIEMSKESLLSRMACPAAEIAWRDVISDNITEDQKKKLFAEVDRLSELLDGYLFIEDASYQTVDTIWECAVENGLDAIYVDHLGLMKDHPKINKVERLGLISAGLKDIAKSLNLAAIILCQLNRAVDSRPEKKPELSDLRASGEIEENADIVFMMYREGYYNLDEGKDIGGETELLGRKFRDGVRNDKIILHYDLKNQIYTPRPPF